MNRDDEDKPVELNPSEWDSDRHKTRETQFWDMIGGIIVLALVFGWVAIFGR